MYRNYFKTIIDYCIAIIVLPFFLIILIVVGIAIKIEDGGPIFYIAERIGKNSKKLNMYKFRSMKVGAPNVINEDGSTYNSKNDIRVTRVGKFLRATSIDETAQILNVLNGSMSIIGPRASNWNTLDTYREDELGKMNVKPGISGYTQAYYRNSISVRDKRLMDVWYANHVSIILDMKIIFKTIKTVVKHENIYTNK